MATLCKLVRGLSIYAGYQTNSTILTASTYATTSRTRSKHHAAIKDGPGLQHFIANSVEVRPDENFDDEYLPPNDLSVRSNPQKVFIETYGCQMNVNDSEVVWAVLKKHDYKLASSLSETDVILLVTCAIREGAEDKIWQRVENIKSYKNSRSKPLTIGIMGCMAERLKEKILDSEKSVDLVCGPDAYKDLPRLLAATRGGSQAINVKLSLEETYSDVTPVRLDANKVTSYVSIMRGCDNMCSYCIVPFTRGRERSRPFESILTEVKYLSETGVKEVTLLGQNVNSYRDVTGSENVVTQTINSRGFKTLYRPKKGGKRFAELLEAVANVDPEMRVRFTAPHPKDFPDDVLQVIREKPNVCQQLHLPPQSGSSAVLERMRRGYTREAYLDLVDHIRALLPRVAFTADIIAGFCGETDEDHELTLDLMRRVNYHFSYVYPYSMRQRTHAHHRLTDDVPRDVKLRRYQDLSDTNRTLAAGINAAQVGETQLVLIEQTSKRSEQDMAGRNTYGTKVIVPRHVKDEAGLPVKLNPGDYVKVTITDSTSQTLKSQFLEKMTQNEYYHPS